MNTEQMQEFVAAYLAANKIAQGYAPDREGFKGPYRIADDMGHALGSLLWDAAVSGASAYYIRGSAY